MKSKILLLCFITYALLLSACKRDLAIDPADGAELESFMQDEMDRQRIPAMSVTIFKGTDVVFESQQGQADREKNIALDANHLFLLASVSKAVTAVALLQLYERGLFGLDDPINNYLPFSVVHPQSNKAITFRHLFTHTSGITDGSALLDEYYYGIDSPVDLGDFLKSYLTPSGADYDDRENFSRHTPGEHYAYTNAGASLMGYLVTVISGMDFNDFCKQNIFQPLGMTHSFWHLSETDTNQIVRPYIYKRGDYQPLQHYTFTDYPDGGLHSTGRDLARFFGACANGGNYLSYHMLQTATLDDALKPQIPEIEEGQGLIFYIVLPSEGLWGHTGGESGVTTIAAFSPVTQVGVTVLANVEDANLDDIAVSAYRLGLKL
jgi:CubicO group peptidase (beta-lactamase class C family)